MLALHCTRRLTVTRHHAYIATRPVRISLPKASFATSKLLLPFLRVSSASFNAYSRSRSINGGFSAIRAKSATCEAGLRGGQGGSSGEIMRRLCRWVMREAPRMTSHDVRRKKMNSLDVSLMDKTRGEQSSL